MPGSRDVDAEPFFRNDSDRWTDWGFAAPRPATDAEILAAFREHHGSDATAIPAMRAAMPSLTDDQIAAAVAELGGTPKHSAYEDVAARAQSQHSATCWLMTDQPGNPVNGLRICTCAASLTDTPKEGPHDDDH